MIGATGLIMYVLAGLIGVVDAELDPDELTIWTRVSQAGQFIGGLMLMYSLVTVLWRFAP